MNDDDGWNRAMNVESIEWLLSQETFSLYKNPDGRFLLITSSGATVQDSIIKCVIELKRLTDA